MPNYKDSNNKLYFLDSSEHEYLLPAGCVEISDAEAEAIRAASIIPATWIDKRLSFYPSIQQQLDMQYHDRINGTTVWQDTITGIKQLIPKD